MEGPILASRVQHAAWHHYCPNVQRWRLGEWRSDRRLQHTCVALTAGNRWRTLPVSQVTDADAFVPV